MPNGDQAIWDAIRRAESETRNLARDGCGHKEWHEKISNDIRTDLVTERKDRELMGEKLFSKLDTIYWMVIGSLGGIIVVLLKSYLPAIFGK